MQDMAAGIYERLITEELQRCLRDLDPALVHRAPLDSGDAYDVLARHLGQLARRALRSVSGDGAPALVRQVELANQIADAIVALAPRSSPMMTSSARRETCCTRLRLLPPYPGRRASRFARRCPCRPARCSSTAETSRAS